MFSDFITKLASCPSVEDGKARVLTKLSEIWLTLFFPCILSSLASNLAIARGVAQPAGLDTKGKGLEEGFLKTFPNYTVEDSNDKFDTTSVLGTSKVLSQKIHHFRSRDPVEVDGANRRTFLSFSLYQFNFETEAAAATGFNAYLQSRSPESNAPSFMTRSGNTLYLLNAGCIFSDANRQKIAQKLIAAVKGNPPFVRCSCGGGCSSVSIN